MSTASLLRRLPRRSPLVEVQEEAFEPISQYHHDLIIRYCLIGIFVILATGALYATKTIALPVATGIVFGMVLGPATDAMVTRGMPQQAAAALIVLLGVAVMACAAALLALPVASWSDQIPAMLAAVQARIAGLFGWVTSLWSQAAPGNAQLPGILRTNIGDLAAKLPLIDIAMSSSAAIGGVLVFIATVYFYLATRRHLKARLLRLCLGREARRSAGMFFVEIERRVATYLGLVTVINLVCGALAMGIAWAAGLSYPIFWGAFAFVLNYLAFVGPAIVIATLFAAGLLGEHAQWTSVWPAGAYLLVHLLESNVVTPTVVGNRMTVSPFLVFVSFVFWLWLWGPVGAVLSTPILIIAISAKETFKDYRQTSTAEAQ
jgi:predicted PurR-regulated permease PerM